MHANSVVQASTSEGSTKNTRIRTVIAATLLGFGAGHVMAQSETTKADQKLVPALLAELAKHQADDKRVTRNIATFDNLDFDVFTKQKWDRLHESHSFGQGEWTAVIGVMKGTFTKPMPIGDGKTIAPTGKAFRLTMATVGHWKGETMDEEYLFWDNATFMKQVGLGQ